MQYKGTLFLRGYYPPGKNYSLYELVNKKVSRKIILNELYPTTKKLVPDEIGNL